MKKVDSLAGPALAIVGLAVFGLGIYFTNFSTLCAPGETAVICLRSWIAAIGPIVAILALIIALSQFWLSRDSAQRQLRAYWRRRRIIPTC